MTDLGTIVRDCERVGLRYRRLLRHSPERVWRALTEADDLRHWFPCDIVGERHAGAPLTMPFWQDVVERFDLGDDPVLHGEVLAWDPVTLFEFRWDSEILRWELTPHQNGTELVLSMRFVPEEEDSPDEQAATGYHAALESLTELLNTGTVRQPTSAWMQAVEFRYRLAFA